MSQTRTNGYHRNGKAQQPPPLPEEVLAKMPRNLEAEAATLSAMIRANHTISEVATIVRVSDFSTEHNQLTFAAIMAVWEKGEPADYVTVSEYLVKSGACEHQDIGKLVSHIYGLSELPQSGLMAGHYAKIVQDRSVARACAVMTLEVQKMAMDGVSGAELLEAAEREILKIGAASVGDNSKTMPEMLAAAHKRIQQRCEGQLRGVPTGLVDLDNILCGLSEGELVIIGARPSIGKTSLATTIAVNASKVGHNCIFFTLEQSYEEIGERFLVMEGMVDSHSCRRGQLNQDQWERINSASERGYNLPLRTDDSAYQSITRIAAVVRRQNTVKKVDLVLIDYLQLIQADGDHRNREQEVASITRRAKLLAREAKVPVVLLAQLNRGSEEGKGRKPKLSDLRESGSQEQDADVVILLWKPETEDGDVADEVEAVVAKNRNGRTGSCKLAFIKQCMKFENYAAPMYGGSRA